MTKQHNIIVLSVAVILSAGTWLFAFTGQSAKKTVFSVKVSEGLNGWGYDILVNDSLFIRQESVPLVAGKKGFLKKEQAEQTAQLIINKMERGQPPVITTFELEQILTANKMQHDQPGTFK